MDVSVVIPVYRAELFIERAVKSALDLRQVAEIILVEDGSPDNSLVVCKRLAEKNERVRLIQHKEAKNRGAAASRNVGMLEARHDFIALLDADDYYLPSRFEKAEEVFLDNSDCDGVYGAVGIEFLDKQSQAQWLASPMQNVKTTTMTKIVSPDNLLRSLLKGMYGRFHINGLVFKKKLLERSGMMNEKLASMHEDTDFIFRLAITGRLYPGQLNSPVAVRCVHGSNRISAVKTEQKRFKERLKMHMETYRWCRRNSYKKEKNLLINRMVNDCLNVAITNSIDVNKSNFRKAQRMIFWASAYPDILIEKVYWKELAGIGFSTWKKV